MPETYVKMPEGDYVDICDEVRRLTDSEEDLTSGDVYDALADSDGVWSATLDAGKVVPTRRTIGLITQTSRTVTENGTYDTIANNSVVVDVPGSGGATVQTVTGTLANPWGSISVSDLFTALSNGTATAYIVDSVAPQQWRIYLYGYNGIVLGMGGQAYLNSSNKVNFRYCEYLEYAVDGSINLVLMSGASGTSWSNVTDSADEGSVTLTVIWHPLSGS